MLYLQSQVLSPQNWNSVGDKSKLRVHIFVSSQGNKWGACDCPKLEKCGGIYMYK